MLDLDHYFKNHVITKQTPNEIVFREPNTSIGYMRFLLTERAVIVLGDYGSAIYEFPAPTNFGWEWLGDLDASYLAKKCTAGKAYQFSTDLLKTRWMEAKESALQFLEPEDYTDILDDIDGVMSIEEHVDNVRQYTDASSYEIYELTEACDDISLMVRIHCRALQLIGQRIKMTQMEKSSCCG